MPSFSKQRFRDSQKLRRKRIATQHIEKLLDLAKIEHKEHPEFSTRHAEIAWKLSTRFNIRLGHSRALFCHNCKLFILPPYRARYRLSKKSARTSNITCLNCGFVYRKIL